MPRPSNRDNLVRSGTETLRRRGLHGASVRDITNAADVSLGSFTNHFATKTDFVASAMDFYFAGIESLVKETLGGEGCPLDRLRAYFEAILSRFRLREWRDGCLIGNLSVEAPEHSEDLRRKLDDVFTRWREPFAECLVQAQSCGQLSDSLDPLELADFLIASWQGAILRMKVERSSAPLDRFMHLVFDHLLVVSTESQVKNK